MIQFFPARLMVASCLLAAFATLIRAAESGSSEVATHDPTQRIDALIEAGWQRAGVRPSGLCDDATFVRRVGLDLIGRIPTPDERADFLSDSRADRRQRWIDRLLDSPEYARHMAEVFDALLLGRPRAREIARRESSGWREYLQEAFAANRPWNLMARDLVLARATDQTDPRAGWFLYERRDAHQEIAEAVAPALFGIRIECAQCHDHPLASEIQQAHYWGLVAFFNRSKNVDTPNGPRVAETASGGNQKFTDLAGDAHETLLTFFQSAVVDEPLPTDGDQESDDAYIATSGSEPRVPKFSRRGQFADQILADHPLVARAMVNRLWALLMGRGIVHPHDRMDSIHPPSDPDLLDWLAEDFRASGYDVRRLVRNIVRSRCYQLDSRPADARALPEHFAYGLTKPLPAESLLRSIGVALQGTTSEPDAALLQQFCSTFPDVLPDEPTSNLSQALLLTNHPEFHRLLDPAASPVLAELASRATPREQVEGAFLAALGRTPEADELEQAESFLGARPDGPQATWQLMWALLTSAEFRLNH